jgi:hypothetical protein
MTPGHRVHLLERYGRLYGDLRLAIAFTETIDPSRGDPKRISTKGWDRTKALPDSEYGAGILKMSGQKRNPAVVLRPSNLIGIDCDRPDRLEQLDALDLPPTVTVQSSEPYKLHFWYRPANGRVPYVAFRFEDKISADSARYLLVPPAIHPSGATYTFLRSPEDTEIAVLSPEKYDELVKLYEGEQQLGGRSTPAPAEINAGARNDTLFRFACRMRRAGADNEEILGALVVMNEKRCRPTLPRDELERIAESTLRYTPATPVTDETDEGHGPTIRIVATPMAEIEMRSIEWLERPLWQKSAFELFAASKGAGKGTYLAGLAARISNAGQNVVFISTEDSASIDLKPRLVAARANIDRCSVIRQPVRLPEDIEGLRAMAERLGGVGLLVIDPVANHIGDRNSNSDSEVRDAIAPLNRLADELGCLLIGVRHPGKDRSRGAVASILGSTAWVDVPRAVVMIAVDDQDPTVRHIQVVAGNRSLNGAAQSFRIEAVPITGLDEPITVAVDLGESTKSVDTLLTAQPTGEESKSDQARDRILDLLEGEGDQDSDVLDARIAADTGLKAKTIRNLRTGLADQGLLKPYPVKDEHGAILRWRVGRTGAPR